MTATTRLSSPMAVERGPVKDRPSEPAPSSPPSEGMRVLRPRRAAPADAVRPTRAEINLASLRHNLRVVQKHARGAAVWAVLKADGYGHGAPAVARTLERAGADGFCVALLEEGIELREAGIRAPILVMGGYYGGAQSEVIARGLVPVVYDLGQVEGFAREVRSGAVEGPVDVHLKVDTGMARLGVTMKELAGFAERLADFPEVRVRGLMTHLACADALTSEETLAQTIRFDEATALLARYGVRAQVRHAANSAALLRGDATFDAVRPGVSIFGVSPRAQGTDGAGEPLSTELRAVMRVRSEVIALREIAAGDAVGYGALWRASRASRIATVPMGYADGMSRQLSNRGHVLVRGHRAPIVGAVSMDMSMIDVTDLPGVSLRDEVVVLGAQEGALGKGAITPDELAAHAGTIPWEVMTSISRRVPRFYREP
ncbi:MAG TPA: alanine racemase [Polyangiaceae bacterium]